MPTSLLLHPAAHVVDGGEPQPHDVEGIQYPHRARQTGRQGGAIAAERIQGRHLDTCGPLGGLANQPVGQHFPASTGNNVDELSAVQVDDAGGEHRRADRVGAGERRLIHHLLSATGSRHEMADRFTVWNQITRVSTTDA